MPHPDDRDLTLDRVKIRADQVGQAKARLDLRRADLNTEIRRAKLAGRSLREIARAAKLTPQRVDQIVQEGP